MCSQWALSVVWSDMTILKISYLEGVQKKVDEGFTSYLKTADSRVKSQARGQNNESRALKWGLVYLCSLLTFRDRRSFIEVWVFWISHFCKKMRKLLC